MLPTTAFKSVVRAEFLMKNMTVEAVEYVDESVNAATIVMTQKGQKVTMIMSYQTDEVFYIAPSASTGADTAGSNVGHHISGIQDLWPGKVVGKSAGLVIERLRVRIPAVAAGKFSSPKLTLCADSCSVSVTPPCYRSGT